MPPIGDLTALWIFGRQIELTWRDLRRRFRPGREALPRTRVLSTGRVKARAARSLRSQPPRTSSSPPRAPPIAAAAASQSRRPLLLHNPLQRLLLQSSRSSSPNLPVKPYRAAAHAPQFQHGRFASSHPRSSSPATGAAAPPPARFPHGTRRQPGDVSRERDRQRRPQPAWWSVAPMSSPFLHPCHGTKRWLKGVGSMPLSSAGWSWEPSPSSFLRVRRHICRLQIPGFCRR
jgi:hypothetical protein